LSDIQIETSNKEFSENDIQIWPNPINGQSHIQVSSWIDSEMDILVFNTLGKKVFHGNGLAEDLSKRISLFMKGLSGGLYSFTFLQNGSKSNRQMIQN